MFVGTGAGGENRKLYKTASSQKTTEGMEESQTGGKGKRGNETYYISNTTYCIVIQYSYLQWFLVYICGIDTLNFSGDFCFKLLFN